jgi:drug/metabolite transporter (DMT)-like permease
VALLVLAACFWTGTSVYSKHLRLPKDPILSSTLQMVAGGILMTAYGFVAGEMTPASIAAAPPKIWGAIVYLAVIGSCLGFTAYSWLLLHQPANRVSSYAFVNPLVAVLLGVVWGKEGFTAPIACALTLIGVGVSISLFGDRWKKILKGAEKTAPLEAT